MTTKTIAAFREDAYKAEDRATVIAVNERGGIILGGALIELRGLGVPQSDLAEMTGLSARDVGAAIRSAKNSEDDNDEASGESESESTGSASEDAETGTAVDSSDSNGASNH